MDNNKKFELNADALDEVAGGRSAYGIQPQNLCARCKNACSSCGGHDFMLSGATRSHYHGNCKSCGTYNEFICRVDFADAEYYWELG